MSAIEATFHPCEFHDTRGRKKTHFGFRCYGRAGSSYVMDMKEVPADDASFLRVVDEWCSSGGVDEIVGRIWNQARADGCYVGPEFYEPDEIEEMLKAKPVGG